MITGYFYFDVEEKNGETRQIKKIFKLVLEANVLYLLWDSFYAVLSRNMSFLLDTFTIENVLKFIAFNESPLKGHLWYLGAILYVLIIMHIFDKLKIEKCLVFAAPFLLMGDLILGKYSVLLLGREFPYILVRNFLFVGIPYFCIGRLIRNGFGQKVKKKVLTIFLIVFSATSLLERFALVSLNVIQQEIIISVRPYWLLRYSYLPCNVMGVIKH